MTNFEKYKDRIADLSNRNYAVAKVYGKLVACEIINDCGDCDFCNSPAENCSVNLMRWLLQEYKEVQKLTKRDRLFCEIVQTGWICRDEGGLYYFKHSKPCKIVEQWDADDCSIPYYTPLDVLNLSFSFIKTNDDEPWAVEDLLKLEVE